MGILCPLGGCYNGAFITGTLRETMALEQLFPMAAGLSLVIVVLCRVLLRMEHSDMMEESLS